MGWVPTELSLDLRPTFVPKTITDFLCQLSTIPSATHKLSTLDDLLARLELELTKIDAFKRELPLCMILLNDAISALKVESAKCRAHKSEPVLEEFIPLKKECDQKDQESIKEKEYWDKKNWMSSVQLWNTTIDNNNNSYGYDIRQNYKLEIKRNEEEREYVAEDLFQYGRNRNGGRGFVVPFSTYSATKEEKEDFVVNGLSRKTPGTVMKDSREGFGSCGSRTSFGRVVPSSPQQKTARKQRRSWSPELHRRFVEALEELGGSQAATPKQIRAFMRVDGLTNDEVKSHLQKYRLHTRRVPPAPAATANNQCVVVPRGLWMYNNDSSKGNNSGSGSLDLLQQLTTGSVVGTSPTKGDNMEDCEDVKPEF